MPSVRRCRHNTPLAPAKGQNRSLFIPLDSDFQPPIVSPSRAFCPWDPPRDTSHEPRLPNAASYNLSLSSHRTHRLLRSPPSGRNLSLCWQLPLFPLLGQAATDRCAMSTIDRQQLDRLERRGFQLTIFSAIFVFILAGGLVSFMYPLVFLHPEGN